MADNNITKEPVQLIDFDGNELYARTTPCLVDGLLDDDKKINQSLLPNNSVVKFITLTTTQGELSEEELALLNSNQVNRFIYNNSVYYLSIKDGTIRKYFTQNQSTEFNEIDVDTETGGYIIFSKLNPIIDNHIKNTIIHITANEREFWNNKVSAEVEEINTNDYNLLLKKD